MSPFRSSAKFSSDMHIPSSFLFQPRPHSLRVFGSDWKAIHHAVLDAMTLAKSTPLLWPASEVTDWAKNAGCCRSFQ
jgi:membrane-bound metal-dependent hydrolase YbcI (DUF457 family)